MRPLEQRPIERFVRLPDRSGAPSLLLLLAALAAFPAPCEALRICEQCMSINDTTATPGKVATPRWIRQRAITPPVAFVGADGLLHCAVPAASGWQIESVDPISAAGGLSIELDPSLEPIVGYHDSNGMPMWAHRTPSGWERHPIDPAARVIGATSSAAVPGGLGIAYVDVTTGLLVYAEQNAGGVWNFEAVAPVGASESYPSLIVDGTSRAISYYDAQQRVLRLALRQVAGVWSTSLVDGALDVGGYTSLVGGPSAGGFGIAYYDFTHGDLRYAHGTPGAWAIETVDSAGNVGQFCSAVALAGTPEDRIGIGYYDRTQGDLKYALKQGTAWTTVVLDSAGDTGGSVSCGATPAPDDTTGIAYVDRGAGDLNYLRRTSTLSAVPLPEPSPASLRVDWVRAPDGSGGRIRFQVPAPGRVRITVYDALGRVVAVPLRESLPAGSAETRWDGRNQRGARVGTGAYFVRVETESGAGSALAVLLR